MSIREHISRIASSLARLFSSQSKLIYNAVSRLYVLSGYAFNRDLMAKILLALVIASMASVALLITASLALTEITVIALAALSCSLAGVTAVLMYMINLVLARRTAFSEMFIYTLSHMVPLLASGATLPRVISTLRQVETDPIIRREIELMLVDLSTGSDACTCVKRSIARVPSHVYADVMTLVVEGSRLSQDVSGVLLLKLESLMRDKMLRLRQDVLTSTLLFQTYVILAFLLPCVLIVIAFVLLRISPLVIGACTFDAHGLSFALLLYIPVVTYAFYVIFDILASRM